MEDGPVLVKNRLHSDLNWIDDLRLDGDIPAYSTPLGAMFCENSLEMLRKIPSGTIDLVMTSPPFALTRKKEYGNEPIERYMEWFMPFCAEIKRVLKDNGSFVLDIGGAWLPGTPVRSIYHFELAVKLAKEFSLAQEFYWYNPARLPTPAEWVTVRRVRVKDAVNMVWWFGKTDYPKADNRAILQPYSESMKQLIQKGYKAQRRPSGHNISTKFQKDNGGAIPPNLIQIANTESTSMYLRECKRQGIKPHPARYPESLVEFFIDFLTDENDVVVDPFAGSNVTGSVCDSKRRRWVACELESKYVAGSMIRFSSVSISRYKSDTQVDPSPRKSDGRKRPASVGKKTASRKG